MRGHTMKYVKYLLIVLLILSFALVSCKKSSTTGPREEGPIVGTWNVVSMVFGWLLTTNSDQVATIIDDVTGQVNITGAHTGTLNFMYVDNYTDPSLFQIYNNTDDTQYAWLMIDGSTEEGTLTITNPPTYIDQTYIDQTYIGNITFTFDGTTLTITQSILTDISSSATVTISGSLSFSFNNTDIPANTPTRIYDPTFFGEGVESGSITVEFRSDKTATVTNINEGEVFTENWTYTTSGNQLTITDEYDETITFEYSVSGGTMTWITNDIFNICEDYDTQTNCLADYEKGFGLTAGSLTNLDDIVEYLFSQATAKQGLNFGRNYNLINPTKVIENYKLKN